MDWPKIKISLIIFIVINFSICLPKILFADSRTCPCKIHSAQAIADGVCSRSEDKQSCTLEFTAAESDEYEKLKSFLKELKLKNDPREAFSLATKYPPQKLPSDFLTDWLPVLIAVSQWRIFPKQTPNFIGVLKKNPQKVDHAFRFSEGTSHEELVIGPFKVSAGYGCIEMSKDEFSTMVKTPFSEATYYCDFSDPPWKK